MKTQRTQILFFLLLVAIGLLLYIQPMSNAGNVAVASEPATLPLNTETKAQIRSYFEDITLDASENTLAHAMQLDHGVGRKQMLLGNNKGAFETYRKVLAISYMQGSMQGVGVSLGALSGVLLRVGNFDEATRLAFLEYKVGRSMNKRYEYGLSELRLSSLMDRKDRSMGMAW